MTTEIIVDGNGLVCRLWWANPVNVPERFKQVVDGARPNEAALVRVAWDTSPSWRRDLLPAYKSQRPPKPQALLGSLVECWADFPDLKAEGFEADDLIATECAEALAADRFVVILSDDKDMAQLVGPRCLWLAGGKVYDEGAVLEKFGVPPNRIRHLLSWMGDKVDGLPGVPGYGPKRAVKKALAGEIGNQLTYDLVELAMVPRDLMRKGAA